jgi:hypothetical protein
MTKPATLHAQRDRLLAQAAWMDETIIEMIISEAQNEGLISNAGALTSSPTARS